MARNGVQIADIPQFDYHTVFHPWLAADEALRAYKQQNIKSRDDTRQVITTVKSIAKIEETARKMFGSIGMIDAMRLWIVLCPRRFCNRRAQMATTVSLIQLSVYNLQAL